MRGTQLIDFRTETLEQGLLELELQTGPIRWIGNPRGRSGQQGILRVKRNPGHTAGGEGFEQGCLEGCMFPIIEAIDEVAPDRLDDGLPGHAGIPPSVEFGKGGFDIRARNRWFQGQDTEAIRQVYATTLK